MHQPSPGWQQCPCPAYEGELSKAALKLRSCDSECDNHLFLSFLIVFTQFFWKVYQCTTILVHNEAAVTCGILKRVFFPLVDLLLGEHRSQCQPCSGSPLLGAALDIGAQRQSTSVNSGNRMFARTQQILLPSQQKSAAPLPAAPNIDLPGCANLTEQNREKTTLRAFYRLVNLQPDENTSFLLNMYDLDCKYCFASLIMVLGLVCLQDG